MIIELEQPDGSIIELDVDDKMVMGKSEAEILEMPQVQQALKGVTAPQPSPTAPPPQELGLGEAMWKGIQNFPQSMARQGTAFMDAVTNPEKTLPAMGGVISGGMQNLGQMLGLDQMGGGEGPVMPEPNNPQQQLASALGQDYAQAYGGWPEIKNTIANDPGRIAMEAAPLIPGAIRQAAKVPGVIARNTPGVRTIPEWTAGHSLAPYNPGVDKADLLAAGRTMLERDVPPGTKGANMMLAEAKAASKDADHIVALAREQGIKFDPLKVASDLREEGRRLSKRVPGDYIAGPKIQKIYDKMAEDIVSFVRERTDMGIPPELNVDELVEYRTRLGDRLKDIWEKEAKGGSVQTNIQKSAQKKLYGAYTKESKGLIEGLDAQDKIVRESLNLARLLDNQIEGSFHGALAPTNMVMPPMIEIGARGKPGVITGISVIRHLQSGLEKVISRHLYNRMQNRPMIKNEKFRKNVRGAAAAYSEGSHLESLLEDEVNGQ